MLLESSVSNAPSCGIIQTTKCVIDDHILIYPPRVVIYSTGITHKDLHIFIIQPTGGSMGLRYDCDFY